ncbi:MAG: YlbF family regulator [Oscillospiraceae bacterium]|jgi:cell fate (sporulation/competence/biofilm development) regulator YlbF (YheA/YmcA/DUF963 family)|nr:YlbF family regulator [Oscillospiraceae bacterium]
MDANIESPLAALAGALKSSDTVRNTRRLKEAAFDDPTNAALLSEYQKMQSMFQRNLATGSAPPDEDVKRFQQIASLLMVNPDAQSYMLSQMKLQQMIGEIFQTIANAAELQLPDLGGAS